MTDGVQKLEQSRGARAGKLERRAGATAENACKSWSVQRRERARRELEGPAVDDGGCSRRRRRVGETLALCHAGEEGGK